VSRLAAEGHDVRCVVRQPSKAAHLEQLGAALCPGDVRDAQGLARACQGVDCVYHLAGLIRTLRPAEFDEVNEQGTRNLVAAAAQATTPPVVVLVSSQAAAGVAPQGRPRKEQDAPVPVSRYGRSKLAAERAARQFAAWVPLSIVRPPIVFGSWERDVLVMIRTIARSGVHVIPGWRVRRYSLVHAEDLVEALERVAARGERAAAQGVAEVDDTTGVYYVADRATPSYGELGRMIGEALGRRTRVLMLPPRSIYFAAGFNTLRGRWSGQAPLLNFDKAREALAGSWTCDPSKLERDLDWRPAAPLEARLRQTVEWCRSEGWL
jgi:nucleoside-diphosphate-sugar epimerase